MQARYHLDLADRFATFGYGPAFRRKPFRPHLTMGALSCAFITMNQHVASFVLLRPARHYPRLWLRTPLGIGPTGLSPASNTRRPAHTTSLSDFSRSYIEGLPPKRSPRGPPSAGLPPREPSRTGHHQHLAGDHEISRFSRMELVVRAWDLRPRRARQRLANNAASSIAFRTRGKASAP
jgi:hypothetical protein